ncbi:hypothetical protein COTS27_00532 [Spirochaetota bacterium]|nr:hypothetical protein COTS27_00532 [Spirochaetota bacterium]
MKKFIFPYAALLLKKQEEERQELYELAKIVKKLNVLSQTKQEIFENMEKWRNVFKKPTHIKPHTDKNTHHQDNKILFPAAPGGIALENKKQQTAMRTYLNVLTKEEQSLNNLIRSHQAKVQKKRQAIKKIEILKNNHYALWKKEQHRHERAELQEKILRQYTVPVSLFTPTKNG